MNMASAPLRPSLYYSLIIPKMFRHFFIIISLAIILLIPSHTKAAASLLPFGGYNVYYSPCVCSGFATVSYVWYWPLLPWDPVTGGPLALITPPGSLWYAFADPIAPTTWSLGLFEPGVQACWQPGPDGCFLWPTLGDVIMTGSSVPLSTP